jgi:signal peptidase I
LSQENRGSWRGRNRPYIYAVVFAIFMTFVIAPEVMEDNTMSPAIEKGSVILVTKHNYSANRGGPNIGDVVVMEKNYAKDVSKDNIVARVIAGPGSTVEIKNDKLYVDNVRCKVKGATGDLGKDMKVKLGKESMFLLSDNRDSKVDSRNKKLGPVDMREIKGKAKTCIWPFNRFGSIK